MTGLLCYYANAPYVIDCLVSYCNHDYHIVVIKVFNHLIHFLFQHISFSRQYIAIIWVHFLCFSTLLFYWFQGFLGASASFSRFTSPVSTSAGTGEVTLGSVDVGVTLSGSDTWHFQDILLGCHSHCCHGFCSA